ncbi:DUF354 domain-containing protein [Maribacter sp.]|nr:DUF354 domain-containing protein [Maribacter sp.]
MKIWFDISNSPHVLMFHHLINELESEGHEVIITSRPLANTVALLDQRNLKHNIVGEHYGKNFYKKVFGYPIRVWQLRNFLKNNKPDLAVSQSSFHSPVAAWLLGIPSIYTNDNEHAMGNLPAFYLATQILIPESLPIESIAKKGISPKKITQYPGVKEGIYLWRKEKKSSKMGTGESESKVHIYIRPEPLTAQYYTAKENFLDDTIVALQKKYSITVLARDKTQLEHYKQEKFAHTLVPEKPLDFEYIRQNCTLFIGAGGSMTRELAILGVPTISVYQDDLLEVDKYLISQKVMAYEPSITPELVENHLRQEATSASNNSIMEKGEQAYQMLKKRILEYDLKKAAYKVI